MQDPTQSIVLHPKKDHVQLLWRNIKSDVAEQILNKFRPDGTMQLQISQAIKNATRSKR